MTNYNTWRGRIETLSNLVAKGEELIAVYPNASVLDEPFEGERDKLRGPHFIAWGELNVYSARIDSQGHSVLTCVPRYISKGAERL